MVQLAREQSRFFVCRRKWWLKFNEQCKKCCSADVCWFAQGLGTCSVFHADKGGKKWCAQSFVRNNCVKMHFCSFSVCLCNTDISGCIGWVAADLLHPLTESQISNLSRFLFLKSATGLHCWYKSTHEYHHHILYMGHLQYLKIWIRPTGCWLVSLGCQDATLH